MEPSGRNRSQMGGRGEGLRQAKPLPWVAIVERGSTVRVRQRALQECRNAGLSLSDRVARPTTGPDRLVCTGAKVKLRSEKPSAERGFSPFAVLAIPSALSPERAAGA